MKRKLSMRTVSIAVCIVCVISLTGVAFAAGGISNITAYINEKLHMTFNGAPFKPMEADGSELPALLYKDRTYLPVRAVAEKAGVYVDYDYDTAEVILRSENQLLSRANLVLHYLKYRDFEQLAKIVSTEKGVTFAPFFYVEDAAVKLTADQVRNLQMSDEFEWGASDGSGDPIIVSVANYFNSYVYNQDYINAPRIGKDVIIQSGHSVPNFDVVFPEAHFIEYNFPEIDPQYEGFDWTSLRLFFDASGDDWVLIGIVHDCWTP